jgi:L-phenylalanine/L-methionine N-acetyltransferase
MIRPATTGDFSFIYSLYMHPEINPFLLYEPMNTEIFRPIFDELIVDDVLYVYYAQDVPTGMFKLVQLKHRTAHIAYLGGVAIDPIFAGKSYGASMLQEIIALGSSMNLRRIELSTATHNRRAISLYEKLGFQAEGVLRNYTYLKNENRYIDEVLMSYLYEDTSNERAVSVRLSEPFATKKSI